jgi:transposase
MIVIGADTHKQTHALVALDEAPGRHLGEITVSSRPEGALEALTWAARVGGGERVWAIEDVWHVSARLERELIRHGQAVIGVPPQLMAGARPAGRLRGKRNPIGAAAVALAAIRAGPETLSAARLEGVDLELRRLLDRREDLVHERTLEIKRLRWALHDMHCPIAVQARACPQARAFLDREQAEVKSRREALRCLKRHITRRIYNLLMDTHNTNANAPATAHALT